jgi:oxalate decarboxylase/phosphoglucose isomerase-like protein (cupin superfamily)
LISSTHIPLRKDKADGDARSSIFTHTYTPLHTQSQVTDPLTQNAQPVAMLNLGPCSMLPPHLHPRATNYVVAIHGNTTTYMYSENGARLVTQVLTPGHGTIFPQGSMHMMMNTGTST